jgi:hypothetical protein
MSRLSGNRFNLFMSALAFVACAAAFVLGGGDFAGAETSCQCDKLACDACSVEQGVTFYTTKCGPGDSRVKSCSKPTCLPIEEPTASCPVPPPKSGAGKPRAPIVVQEAPAPDARTASVVGVVKLIQGTVSIVHPDGKKTVIADGAEVAEGDTIESSTASAALVRFDGGNRLHVHPDTKVRVQEYNHMADPEARKALLELIRGKIRNQVEQKYNGKTSSYRVRTPAVVAGVRGTDFIVEHHAGTRASTRVETLGGKVELATLDRKQTRIISSGEGAIYSVGAEGLAAKDKDVGEFIQHGLLSPVYKIPAERWKNLDRDSRVDVARAGAPAAASGSADGPKSPVAEDPVICHAPDGKFNECAWTCVGNPPRQTSCRVDLSTTTCVRTRCNGNGDWADKTRLSPAEARGNCPPSGFVVHRCDY